MLLSLILPASVPLSVLHLGIKCPLLRLCQRDWKSWSCAALFCNWCQCRGKAQSWWIASSVQVKVVIHSTCVTLNMPDFWTAGLKSNFQLCPFLFDLYVIWPRTCQLCRLGYCVASTASYEVARIKIFSVAWSVQSNDPQPSLSVWIALALNKDDVEEWSVGQLVLCVEVLLQQQTRSWAFIMHLSSPDSQVQHQGCEKRGTR